MIVLVVLILAAVTDALSVAWHGARERGEANRAALLAMAIEAAAWLPVLAAIETGAGYELAAASILGSGIGCRLAVRRVSRP